ncbi:SDR family oxidoreductase [Couchioplanes caeruleus]|uniref:SDR family NAD(P)-dependent oxidoreductase n=1 Tax=Couchioplanes caeruleus TaxID=56438 RepID=UPI0020C10DFB|nr:SDR family oxidoreductase [Couchioplanes caeruleus]UQU68624.1 SDR family oxidoreductase [Couchioplanes caeruleus]
MTPYRFTGRTAVVTGAASGIGEQLAHGLAGRGSDLVLIDRDALRLDAVAEAIREAHPGRTVESLVVDLADREAVIAAATGVRERHPRLGLLVNNAGVALGGRFDQVSVSEFEWVMAVNFTAPMLLTHHLLPALKAEPGSHLVNVSSLYGLIAPPGQSAYSSSKFALRGLSEVLRSELLESGVGVTTVHPGGVRTRIAESARAAAAASPDEVEREQRKFAALLTYPPEKAAADILEGVRRRRGRVLVAVSAKVPDLLARLLPGSHLRVLNRLTEAAARGGRTRARVTR